MSAVTRHDVGVIVLSAGKGTRMKSDVPKVLHKALGWTLTEWVSHALESAGFGATCLVLSEDLRGFESFLSARPGLTVALQKNRLGTGDAVAAAGFALDGVRLPAYAAGRHHQGPKLGCKYVLVCTGDTPAISGDTLRGFVDAALSRQAKLAVLGMQPADPTGYGRLVVDPHAPETVLAIVEEKDADPGIKKINLCNTGIVFGETQALFGLLADLKPDNAQREYYLTDCFKLARQHGIAPYVHAVRDWRQFAGVNDRRQLADVESFLNRRVIERHMAAGVTFNLPETSLVEALVRVDADTEIAPNSALYGASVIGRRCRIGAGTIIDNSVIGDGVEIGAGSVIKHTTVAAGSVLPPLTVLLGT